MISWPCHVTIAPKEEHFDRALKELHNLKLLEEDMEDGVEGERSGQSSRLAQ